MKLVGMLVVAKASVEIADGLLEIIDECHVGLNLGFSLRDFSRYVHVISQLTEMSTIIYTFYFSSLALRSEIRL